MKCVRCLKFLFASRLNPIHFFCAYILGWIMAFVVFFFAALIYNSYGTVLDTVIYYVPPALFWVYTAAISLRRLYDIGANRIMAVFMAIAINIPLYWNDVIYLLLPLVCLIAFTIVGSDRGKNRYGDPDSDDFLASVFKIKLSERTMETAFRYTSLITCLLIVGFGTLIYAQRDRFDFTYFTGRNLSAVQSTEPVKADPYLDLINKGNDYWIDGNVPEATKYWKEAEIFDPSRPEVYAFESIPATSTEEMRLLNLAISKSPSYAPAYELRADAYNRRNKFKLALADANKALELGGNTYHVYVYMAVSYLNLHNDAFVLNDVQEAIRENPDDSRAWMLKGMALGDLYICRDAIEAFDTAVEISGGGELETEMRNVYLGGFNPKQCKDDYNQIKEQPLPTAPSTDNSTSG